ncbi:hypothetical protein BT93_G0637 [Corymbia citriodora subsp. variegata]|nr:hypothetical protein BT93_G0637 [Corymbia citriodora subsp. variegata]
MAVSLFLDWLFLNGVLSCGVWWECRKKTENLERMFWYSMNRFNREVVSYNAVYLYVDMCSIADIVRSE